MLNYQRVHFAQEFAQICCSGEPAKGELDAEWDAMARQCPFYSRGSVSNQCLNRCDSALMIIDECWCLFMHKILEVR